MKFTVAKKMSLLAGSALLGIVLLTGLGHLQMNKVFEAADYSHVSTVPALVSLDDLRKHFLNTRIRAFQFLMNADDAKYAEIDAGIKTRRAGVDKALKDYESSLSDDKDKGLFTQEKELWVEYQALLEPLLVESRAHNGEKVREMLVKFGLVSAKLGDVIDEHFEYNVALGKKSSDEAAATKGSALNVSLLIAALALSVVGIIAFVVTRGGAQ